MNDLVIDVEQEASGRREQNKASKRRRILEAATELFTEQGFEATTTAQLAKRAGIGAGTLYLYVDSKEDLLVAVFAQQVGPAWDEAFEIVDSSRPLIDQLLALFNHVAAFHENDTNLARAFFKDLRFVDAPVIQEAEEHVRRHLRRLIGLLEASQASGHLDADVVAADLANNLFALWTALMARHHSGRRTWDQYLTDIERSFRTSLFRLVPTG